jgi:N-acetylglutamate synthase-like GNAT family acetyltransferase
MNDYTFRQTTADDLDEVTALLVAEKMLYVDIAEHLKQGNFIVCVKNEEIMGCVGLEICELYGLCRSFCVKRCFKKQRVAHLLFQKILAFARSKQLHSLYLLTFLKTQYFELHGFQVISRQEAPNCIQKTLQFNGLCPYSDVCMRLIL